jgi:hypothetical protein
VSAQIPDFIELLAACREAHQLGIQYYSNGRWNRVEFPGATPKRKPGTKRKILKRLSGSVPSSVLSSGAAERMLMAAYDHALWSVTEQRDAAIERRRETDPDRPHVTNFEPLEANPD